MSTPKETLAQAMRDLGLVVVSTFVPWSQSRSFKEGAKVTDRSLNWRISLKRNGREILATDYTAGIGHAPSYPKNGFYGGRGLSLEGAAALEFETEKGKMAKPSANLKYMFAGKAIEPDACDVVFSLVSDSSVIDHPSFESWAREYDYDVDSRAAEATYRACLETALTLRASLGESGLATLRNACQDY